MRLGHCHRWDVTPAQAREIQEQLRDLVECQDRFGEIHRVAGVDVGFEDGGKITRAAVAVLGFPDLEVRERSVARLPTGFPYVPGLLSFREIPAVLAAMEGLRELPDLLLCDGQGLAHPRRFGIACHLGVLTDLPSIGVAKSRLVGEHSDPGPDKGCWQPLLDRGEIVGAVVRTRSRVNPLYVSIGHRIGLGTAIRYVVACSPRYRLPETTREAHRLASG